MSGPNPLQQITEIKAKTDNLPDSPAEEATAEAAVAAAEAAVAAAEAAVAAAEAAEAAVIAAHVITNAKIDALCPDLLFNVVRWVGAKAGWTGGDEDHELDPDSQAPFVIDAGNDTWGSGYCIVGSDDTPIRAAKTHFIIHHASAKDAEENASYRIRFAWGVSYAAAIIAGTFTEWEFTPLSAPLDTGPREVHLPKLPAGTKVFAACWCYGKNTGTLSFTTEVLELPA